MQKFLYFMISIAFVVPTGVFAASNIPSVQSKLAKDITHNTANIYATVSPGTSEDNAYWFEWGVVGSNEEVLFKTIRHTISTRGGQREVYASLRGLAPNTQYYFRIVAENQSGPVSGNMVYFTTHELDNRTESIVIVNTRNVINIRDESATVYGYVAPHDKSTQYWLEWGTDEKTEFRSKTRTMNRDGGEVETLLTNLTPGTIYYYKYVAESDRGDISGDIKSFKTKGVKPVVEVKKDQVTTAPITKATDSKKVVSNGGLLDSIFGNSKTAKADTTKTAVAAKDTKNTSKTAAVANAVKDVTVSVKPIGIGGAHQTIEYKVSYKYNRKEAGEKAELKILLPKTVAYVADTTADELLVIDNKDGSRVYILPIGSIKKGDTRTISIIGMLTADAKGIPQVDAKLVFDSNGVHMTAGLLAATAASTTSGVSFPTTPIKFVSFALLIVVVISLILKAKDLYSAAALRATETNKNAEEITKNIEDSLIAKKPEEKITPAPIYNPAVSFSPNMTPIPVKPKLVDEYKSVNINEFGLPGMEVVTNN